MSTRIDEAVIRHIGMLAKRLGTSKKAILEKAREIKSEVSETAKAMKELIAAGKDALQVRANKPVEKTYLVAGDKNGVIVKQAVSGAISIKVSKAAAGDKAGVLKALTKFLG